MKLARVLFIMFISWCYCAVMGKEEYKVYLDYTETFNYDPSLVIGDVKAFKLNRTLTALNITLNLLENITRNNNYKVEVTTYEFLSNEYRQFAIHFLRSFCDVLQLEYTYFFYEDFKPFYVPNKCPVQQGVYVVYNYHPTAASFPNMPFKKCKLELKVIKEQKTLVLVNFYFRMDRDVIYREQFG